MDLTWPLPLPPPPVALWSAVLSLDCLPLPFPRLAGPRCATVCHITHWLHSSCQVKVQQGRSPYASPLQCWGWSDWDIHRPGLHAGEDAAWKDSQCLWILEKHESQKNTDGPDTGEPVFLSLATNIYSALSPPLYLPPPSPPSLSPLSSPQAQYVFIHDALEELITCGDTSIASHNLRMKLGNLGKIVPGKIITGFQDQFEVHTLSIVTLP